MGSDDGVMPQTIEAIKHAKAAGVTILVAIIGMASLFPGSRASFFVGCDIGKYGIERPCGMMNCVVKSDYRPR